MLKPMKRTPRNMRSKPVRSVVTLADPVFMQAKSMKGLPESDFLRMAPSTMRWLAVR